MSHRDDYPYDEALNDIKSFIYQRVKCNAEKSKLFKYLDVCREKKIVTFRYIYQEISNIPTENRNLTPLSNDEKDMISDLFYFWG